MKLLVIILLTGFVILEKDECKVLKEEIAESYEGDCKKGLAHGEGTAEGIDKYIGEFKKGFPHGEGTYTWSNTGNIYKGEWDNGLMHGEGALTVKRVMYGDSLVEGYWHEGEYIGRYKFPYKLGTTRNVARVSINRIADFPNEIEVRIFQNGVRMNNQITTFNGVIDRNANAINSNTYKGFTEVDFPAKLNISFTATNSFGQSPLYREVNCAINQEGKWLISIKL